MSRPARGTPALWLIAGREFHAYVATASFAVALLVGPLLSAGAMLALGAAGGAPTRTPIALDGPAPADLVAALRTAGAVEGQQFRLVPDRATRRRLKVSGPDDDLRLTFSADFPLSPAGRQLVAVTLQRDRALAAAATAAPTRVTLATDPGAQAAAAARLARLVVVMMLWLTLTGSMGMLLQAVVRERTNRALETLLAAAEGWEIVFGKLLGVGGVSLLVLASWLGSCALLGLTGPSSPGIVSQIVHEILRPALLGQAAGAYILGFGFYGLVTIAVGATARDVSAAQNLSRPMFAVLLAGFFAALAIWTGAGAGLAWLAYLPPFSPFILILVQPTWPALATSFGLLIVATAVAARVAVSRLK